LKRIVIFANGELPDPDREKAKSLLLEDDYIIAADGGMKYALALGLIPKVIIGDLDSISENFDVSTFNGEIIKYSHDKDETDLQLAIQHALALNPEEIVIVAALGGRLDHSLGNIALLSDANLEKYNVKLDDGIEEVFFCRNQVQIDGAIGDIVSLIPWQGEVTGVLTEGLKWVLKSENLYPQKTRGISNEMTSDTANIQIQSGLLLVVHNRN
jgi:thiamine pyrophosphokinase